MLSTSGDTYLGGEDFDKRIMDWLIETFQRDTGIDLRDDRMALQRLKEAAERAKCELSMEQESRITLPFISADNSGPKHLNAVLTRREFEKMVEDLVQRTIDPVNDALQGRRHHRVSDRRSRAGRRTDAHAARHRSRQAGLRKRSEPQHQSR